MKPSTELRYDENYHVKITSRMNSLGKAEQRAANYILHHPMNCVRMSVAQLSEACGCSGASIIRLCKDLGYSGFSELKYHIQQSGANPANEHLSISSDDTTDAVIEKTFQFTQQSLNSVFRLLNPDSLSRASYAVANADRVLLCAMGSANGAALAGTNHLLSAGINASFPTDDVILMRSAAYLGPSDVLIGINYDGGAKSVVDALVVAKRNKATTILITSNDKGIGVKYADIVLLTPKRSANSTLNFSTTTICQIMLIHLLLTNAWQFTGTKLEAKARDMRALTNMKRYAPDIAKIDIKPVKQ